MTRRLICAFLSLLLLFTAVGRRRRGTSGGAQECDRQ